MAAVRRRLIIVLLIILQTCRLAAADKPAAAVVSVAAAANLTYAIEALNLEFQAHHPGARITTTLGASGSLFAQIRHGAPYDVFLSADTQYPAELAAAGAGVSATLQTFARGRLVLWTTNPRLPMSDLKAALTSPALRKLAIAQPRSAPYGRAAQTVLEQLGLWSTLAPRLVIGENIAQAAQFVETGNADAGFVALSFVLSRRLAGRGSYLEIPAPAYPGVTLAHGAILTQHGRENVTARQYLEFLRSSAAQRILRDQGYSSPE